MFHLSSVVYGAAKQEQPACVNETSLSASSRINSRIIITKRNLRKLKNKREKKSILKRIERKRGPNIGVPHKVLNAILMQNPISISYKD